MGEAVELVFTRAAGASLLASVANTGKARTAAA